MFDTLVLKSETVFFFFKFLTQCVRIWPVTSEPLLVLFPAAALTLSRRNRPGSTDRKFGSSPRLGARWELRRHRSDTLRRSRTMTSAWPLTANWSSRRIKGESRRSWLMKPARPLPNRRCISTGRTMRLKTRCLWNWFTKKMHDEV